MKGFVKRSSAAPRAASIPTPCPSFSKSQSIPKLSLAKSGTPALSQLQPILNHFDSSSSSFTSSRDTSSSFPTLPTSTSLANDTFASLDAPEYEALNKFKNNLLSLKVGNIRGSDDNLFAEMCEDIVLFADGDGVLATRPNQEITGQPIKGLKKDLIDLFVDPPAGDSKFNITGTTPYARDSSSNSSMNTINSSDSCSSSSNTSNILTNPFFSGSVIEDPSEAFYIVDLGDVMRAFSQWHGLLPYVKPFYAIKCNNDLNIIKMLKLLGCGFDCASKQEFEYLYNNNIVKRANNNVTQETSSNTSETVETVETFDTSESSDLLIFSNPCKHGLHLEYARENGINLCTFDSEYELDKIKMYHPECQVLLRVAVDDSKSMCQFNSKFGINICDTERIEAIFDKCVENDINMVGIMFHVGSGCTDARVYYNAIAHCRQLFDLASARHDMNFSLLDLGGGFTCDEVVFTQMAQQINQAMSDYFAQDYNYFATPNNWHASDGSDAPNASNTLDTNDGRKRLKVVAEPGRYFAEKSHTLVSEVFAKKLIENGQGEDKMLYYINEGLYHSFNAMYFDHQLPNLMLYNAGNETGEQKLMESKIFGPTCDSMDKLYDSVMLPDLDIGDRLITTNFGAYSIAGARNFNGFPLSKSYHVVSM